MAEARKPLGVFARNITSNLAGYLVGAVVAVLLAPFVLRQLGLVSYGFWVILVSLTGYYGLLDLGVRSAVGQYVTRHWAKNDMDGVNRTLSTSLVLLSAIAVLAAVLTGVLWFLLPGWLEGKNAVEVSTHPENALDPAALAQLVADGQLALLIAGLGTALSIPMALGATITYARERFEIANAIGISERLLLAGITVYVLLNGYGLVGVAIATTGTQFLANVARIVVGYRLMPGLRVTPLLFTKSSVRELASFGIYSFAVNAADRVVLYMDAILIGAVLTLQAVPFYDFGMKLIPYYMSFVLAITWTLTPYATACDARGDTEALRRLFLKGTRGTVFVAAVIGAGLLFAGDEFLPIWLEDPEFFSGAVYTSSSTILAILAWATLARASTSCGRQILFGMRRMRLLASLAFVEASINIGVSYVLIQTHGLAGVAIGTLVSILLVYVLAQNYFVVKITGAGGGDYAGQILRAVAPVMVAMWLVSLWIDATLVIDTWSMFAVEVILLLIPVLPIGYFLVATDDERQLLLRRLPFRSRSRVRNG